MVAAERIQRGEIDRWISEGKTQSRAARETEVLGWVRP